MRPVAALLALALALTAAVAAATPEADMAAFVLANQVDAPLAQSYPNPFTPGRPWILVGIASQTLTLFDGDGRIVQRYTVSTARLGVGEQVDSYQTPRGWHRVCAKIGDDVPPDTILYHRNVTPWRFTDQMHTEYPKRDWILGRILWLCGMEPGRNQGEGVDSHDRAIYIHGAGGYVPFGTPTSRGCVRMRTGDVAALYPQVALDTDVDIEETL